MLAGTVSNARTPLDWEREAVSSVGPAGGNSDALWQNCQVGRRTIRTAFPREPVYPQTLIDHRRTTCSKDVLEVRLAALWRAP